MLQPVGGNIITEDYIVIGSGSTGSSIVYNLAKLGKKVTLVERNGIASGNTGKSSALVRTHYSNELIAKMALYSLNTFMNFHGIGHSGFNKTGMFFPFDNKYAKMAKENTRMLRGIGIVEEDASPDLLKNLYPDINLEGYDYVAYEPESGYADPVLTANSFVNKSRELGAKIMLKNRASIVGNTSTGASVTLDDGTKLKASKVILATNIWTNDLLNESGISKSKLLRISPSLHGLIYLRRPEEYIGEKPTLIDSPNLAYYKMEGKSVTSIGSLDPKIDSTPVDIHEFIPETTSEDYLEDYLQRICSRLPWMEKANLISTLTGMYDMTPDGQAIIDTLSALGMDNVYVCAGLSGHGFKLSPAYGKIVADMVTGVDPDKAIFRWKPFRNSRFSEGKLIKSLYSEVGTIY